MGMLLVLPAKFNFTGPSFFWWWWSNKWLSFSFFCSSTSCFICVVLIGFFTFWKGFSLVAVLMDEFVFPSVVLFRLLEPSVPSVSTCIVVFKPNEKVALLRCSNDSCRKFFPGEQFIIKLDLPIWFLNKIYYFNIRRLSRPFDWTENCWIILLSQLLIYTCSLLSFFLGAPLSLPSSSSNCFVNFSIDNLFVNLSISSSTFLFSEDARFCNFVSSFFAIFDFAGSFISTN